MPLVDVFLMDSLICLWSGAQQIRFRLLASAHQEPEQYRSTQRDRICTTMTKKNQVLVWYLGTLTKNTPVKIRPKASSWSDEMCSLASAHPSTVATSGFTYE